MPARRIYLRLFLYNVYAFEEHRFSSSFMGFLVGLYITIQPPLPLPPPPPPPPHTHTHFFFLLFLLLFKVTLLQQRTLLLVT